MADEIRSKKIELTVVADTKQAQKAATDLEATFNSLMQLTRDSSVSSYWKNQATLINMTTAAFKKYNKVASEDNAKELLKTTNALKALSGGVLPDGLQDVDKIKQTVLELSHIDPGSNFSVESFEKAFRSLKLMNEYGLNTEKIFSKFNIDTSSFFVRYDFNDDKFQKYFYALEEGSMNAQQAIAAFRREYSYLFEENGSFDSIQLQDFSKQLDEILRKTTEVSEKIEKLSTDGVKVNESANTENLEQLTSAMSELGNSNIDSGLNSVYESLAKVLSIIKEIGQLDSDNLYNITAMIRGLSRLDDLKINKASLENLADCLERICNIADTSSITSLSTLELSKFNDLHISKASLNNLATYLPEIANINVGNLKELTSINFENLNGLDGKSLSALKEFVSELQKSMSSSTPSTESADLNKVQQAAQEAATAKESFVIANEKVASSVDGSISKLQEEANLFKQVAENAKTAAENKKAFTNANEKIADSRKKTGEKGTSGKADVTTDTNDLSASHSENRLPKNVKKYIKKGTRTPSIDTGNHDNEITVSSVSDLGTALKKLQSEIIASIDESTSFVKEVTDFYDSNDNLLKSQLKVVDKDGSMRTYTTSFNKNEDDSFTAWTSHIETQKFPDENKAYEDARQSEVSTALKDQVNAYKEIQNIREKMSQTSDSNMLSELSKEKKEYQEQYLAASKILKANSDLYDSEKQLGELKKISTKTSNKIAQNQIKSNAKEQSQNDKYLSDKSKASYEKEAKLEEEIYNLRKKNIGAKKSEVAKNNELIKGKKKEIEQEQEYRKASGLDDKNEEAKNQLINKRTSLMKDLDTAQNAYNKSLRIEDQEAKSKFKKKAKESSSKITSALDEYKNASDDSKKKASDLLDSISGFTYYDTEAKVNKSNVSSEVKRIQSETNEIIKALKTEHEKVQAEQEKLNKSRSSELQNSVQRQLNNNIDRYSTISKRMASGRALSTDAKELAKVKKEIETIQNSDILPADKLEASKDRIQQIDIAVDDLKKKLKEDTSDFAQSVIDKYQRQVNNSLKNSNTFKPSEGYKKAITDLQSSINELDKFKKKIADQPMLSEEDFAEFERLKKKVEDASQALKNFSSSAKGMKGVSIEKEISKINQTLNQNPRYSRAAKEALHELLQELESGVSTKGLDEIHQKLLQIQNDETKAGRSGKGLIDVIKEKQWYGLASQIAGMVSLYDVINVFKEAASTVTQLNSDITDLAKVSEASTSQIYKDFSSYANIAKDIGGTISDTISATAAWAKNGYDIPDSKELARVSQLYKNVGDNIDIDAANESLISTLKGFNMEADQAEHIVDIFNEVSNNEAISSSGIGDALQRSAAAFNAANTSLEKSVALITATNSVVQDPDKVGGIYCRQLQQCN